MRFNIRLPLFSPEGDAPAGGGGGGTLLSGAGGTPAGDQPAGAGSGGEAWTWAAEDGTFSQGWQDRLSEDLKGNASLATIGSVGDLAKAYVATKGMVGKRLEMPGADAKPEDIANWRKTVGAPEKPEGYRGDAKHLKPEALPDELWNADAEGKFLEIAHKHHLTPAAVKEILNFYGGSLMDTMKAGQADEAALLTAETDKLRTAWGKDFDANLNTAAHMAKMVGLNPADDPIFTNSRVVEAFAKMAKFISGDKLITGEQPNLMQSASERIKDITDPSSQSMLAREYRGDFGPDRQAGAQKQLHDLMASIQRN